MPNIDLIVEICGMSGDGAIAAGKILNEALSRGGLHVLGFDSYPAEIRGFGRCIAYTRFSTAPLLTIGDHTDVLLSLNDEQSLDRIAALGPQATVFFDDNPPVCVPEEKSLVARLESGTRLYPLPLTDLTAHAAGGTRGRNLTILGGLAAVFDLPPELFKQAIAQKFKHKGSQVLAANQRCFAAGYNYAREKFGAKLRPLGVTASPAEEVRVMLSGNQAIAQAALDAGMSHYYGYPITPATPIMEYLAGQQARHEVLVTQMEDEISSIAAVLGSALAGKRSMTATSGPGLALMTELIGNAVMAEIPAVIVNVQRGGPSTGLPTKSEQSDLHIAVFGGPGDCPRIVLAPTNVAESYQYTLRSFQWAEKYQTPVIILSDFFISNRVENIPAPQVDPAVQADGNIYPDAAQQDDYQRFAITPSGISPRAIPGTAGFTFVTTGLEHDEYGLPSYSADNHMRMNAKRHRKIQYAAQELPAPEIFAPQGRLQLGVISWGSTFGAALEAVMRAQQQQPAVGALKITTLYPYHDTIIQEFMQRCDQILIPELNFQGQLANLLSPMYHGPVVRLTLTTGSPFSPAVILAKILALIGKGDS